MKNLLKKKYVNLINSIRSTNRSIFGFGRDILITVAMGPTDCKR